MSLNVGGIDRVLRIILGAALLAWAFFGGPWWVGVIGLVPLLTGLFSICPVYSLLGIKTCPTK